MMKTRLGILSTAMVATVLGGVALAEAPLKVRQSEKIKAHASELRMKAEALRDPAGGKNTPKAKSLDTQADALVNKANRLDSIAWPPND